MAPKSVNDQEIPKKLQEIMHHRESIKSGNYELKIKRKRKSKKDRLFNTSKYIAPEVTLPGMKKKLKPVRIYQQKMDETDNQFIHRLNRESHNLLQQKKFETKFGVDIENDPNSGKVHVTKQKKDEVDDIVEQHIIKQQQKRGKKVRTKEEKRQERREKERQKRKKKSNSSECPDFSDLQDKVEFGETVHAPPSLKNYKFMNKTNVHSKDKSMSLARQLMLTAERERIINAYREIKKQKLK